jgi:GNAT superfamily N-acetyltransferase
MESRPVTAPEVDPAAETLAGLALWTLYLKGSIEHGWVRATPGHEAVALWIPPHEPELTEPSASRLEPLLDDLLGARAAVALEVFERFEAAHPHDEPHYYLSLLGTHPDHRGGGVGMDLLRQNLAAIDDTHVAAYLESSNPANQDRYRSVGFDPIGEFELPDDGPAVTRMWRAAR